MIICHHRLLTGIEWLALALHVSLLAICWIDLAEALLLRDHGQRIIRVVWCLNFLPRHSIFKVFLIVQSLSLGEIKEIFEPDVLYRYFLDLIYHC